MCWNSAKAEIHATAFTYLHLESFFSGRKIKKELNAIGVTINFSLVTPSPENGINKRTLSCIAKRRIHLGGATFVRPNTSRKKSPTNLLQCSFLKDAQEVCEQAMENLRSTAYCGSHLWSTNLGAWAGGSMFTKPGSRQGVQEVGLQTAGPHSHKRRHTQILHHVLNTSTGEVNQIPIS